jgi:hypothetical protein
MMDGGSANMRHMVRIYVELVDVRWLRPRALRRDWALQPKPRSRKNESTPIDALLDDGGQKNENIACCVV